MNANRNWVRPLRNTLLPVVGIAAFLGSAAPASAFLPIDVGNCHAGQTWDVAHPVKVRLLKDSVSDYAQSLGASAEDTREAMNSDIDAVIKLYNSVAGSRLVLERDDPITGDKNLQSTDTDNFGNQTIVIGFTNEALDADKTAEARTDIDANSCTTKRVHIRFRKNDVNNNRPFFWVFDPPDSYACHGGDCRSFFTRNQPQPSQDVSARTFLGILTHEMGHAVGLAHPDDNYAVMAQSSRTWFRGKDEVLHTKLLPDDVAGVLALYGGPPVVVPLDISVTNTWYLSKDVQFPTACKAQIVAANKAQDALAEATGTSTDRMVAQQSSGGDGGSQSTVQDNSQLTQALTDALHAEQACKDGLNADQVEQCLVSSRADGWSDYSVVHKNTKGDRVIDFCATNADHSTFPKVSNTICPSQQLQLRYTLNNHTSLREVMIKTEVWFSSDRTLNTGDGDDVQSPDVRDFTLPAASSAPIGEYFRLPAKVPANAQGETFVFVRAVPFDLETSRSVLDTEADQWNNAVMIPDSIKVSATCCH